jgi:hypothetical protein
MSVKNDQIADGAIDNAKVASGAAIAWSKISPTYGTGAGEVCQGNDSRLADSRTCDNTFDDAAAARSNLSVYSQSEVDGKVAGLYDHKGSYDADANDPDLDTSPSGIKKADAYTVSVAGDFFSEAVEPGDILIADQDDPTEVGHWSRINKNISFGSTTGTACEGDDARLSDDRDPNDHADDHKHNGGDEIATATPGANEIPKADGDGDLDAWISDAATGVKGLIQLDGDLGNTAASPQVGGLGGDALPSNVANGFLKRNSANDAFEQVAYGTIANTVCQGNDSRLSDARTPTAHNMGGSEHSSDTLANLNGKISDHNVGDPVTAQASTPLSPAATDSGKVYTNEGATEQIVFNLPTAAAGLAFTFIIQDSDGIQVVANTGDTIRVAGSATPAAGNIQATTVGNTVKLIAINDTEWIAVFYVGTWTVSS